MVVGVKPHYQPNMTSYYQIPLWVYSPYYSNNSTPFRLVYSSPIQYTSNGMWAQVLIYEYVGNGTTANG
jgi:hypothetical protein